MSGHAGSFVLGLRYYKIPVMEFLAGSPVQLNSKKNKTDL